MGHKIHRLSESDMAKSALSGKPPKLISVGTDAHPTDSSG
jgi:hypothetical protein